MKYVRLVLDTNILINGLISPAPVRPPGLLLDAARRQAVVLVSSNAMMDEFWEVLARPQLAKYLPPGVVEQFRSSIEGVIDIVGTPLPEVTASPDPKDNMILATAVAGSAALIVSGDKRHVLALGTFEGIPIVTAARAVELIQQQPGTLPPN